MFESRYNKVLTVILVIVVIAIIGLLGFLGYDYYKKYIISTEAEDFVNNFQSDVSDDNGNDEDQNNQEVGSWDDINLSDTNIEDSSSSSKIKPTYKGYAMLGTISIPATNCNYPILEKNTTATLDTGVVFIWGVGVNQPGNTVIAGHNYRNGLFFSNNKKLKNGDKIKITDNDKNTIT